MVDSERSQPAPPSLADQKSWRGEDVLERLYNDFLEKCYLCEQPLFGVGSFEVDHRWPRNAGGPHHTWENLFPICNKCNQRRSKTWPEGGLVFPSCKAACGDTQGPASQTGVEARVVQTTTRDDEGRRVPVFRARNPEDRAAINTAKELDHIHNAAHGSARSAARDLRDAIVRRIDRVAELVLEYLHLKHEAHAHGEQLAALEARIRKLTARDAPFTMLVRSAIAGRVPAELFD